MRAHQPQRHDDVARLERARGRLRQERREEHEVLEADDRRAALAEQPATYEPAKPPPRTSVPPRAWRRSSIAPCRFRSSAAGPSTRIAAEEVGRLLAERGCTVVTGGLGEVMAAASRGAKAAGGTTIGILPGEDRADANEWVDHVGRDRARPHAELRRRGIGRRRDRRRGRWGTLAEIAFAKLLGRPVVILEPGLGARGRRPRGDARGGRRLRAQPRSSGRVRHVGPAVALARELLARVDAHVDARRFEAPPRLRVAVERERDAWPEGEDVAAHRLELLVGHLDELEAALRGAARRGAPASAAGRRAPGRGRAG